MGWQRGLRLRRGSLAWFVAVGMAAGGSGTSYGQPAAPPVAPPAAAAPGTPALPETVVEGRTTPTPPASVDPAPSFATPDAPTFAPPTDFAPATSDAPISAGFYSSAFSAPPTEGYGAPTTTTGTLVNEPNLTTPLTVDVVTRDLIRDQQSIRIEELIRNVPGATFDRDNLGRDSLFLRGFEVNSSAFRKNGFLDTTFAPRDVQNIERIEFLKGPASILYGAGEPSGTVNVITKKPLDQFRHVVNGQIGSYGLFRGTLDSTGPIGQSGRLLYRLNMAAEDNDGFRDFDYNKRIFIAPVLTYLLSDDTDITVEGEYLNNRQRFDTGLAAVNGNVRALPIERFLGEPDDFLNSEDSKFSTFINHRFNDCWSVRLQGNVFSYDVPSSGTYPQFQLAPNLIARQRRDTTDFEEENYSGIANLLGEFDTFGLHHKAVFGTELALLDSDNFVTRSSNTFNPFGADFNPFPIDPFNPQYGQPDPVLTDRVRFDFFQKRYGFYTQDLVSLTDRLKVMGGVRYDVVDTNLERTLDPAGAFPIVNSENFYRLSPRAGVLYEVVPEALSVYGNYAQSFNPPGAGARLFDNANLQPETGDLYEVGTKAELGMMTLSASFFHIEKQNVTVTDFNPANFPFFATQIGEQRSRGVELNALGQLTEAWQVAANYAYTDSRITDSQFADRVDDRFRGVPLNQASVWNRYDVVKTSCRTVGVGMGLLYLDERPGDLGDNFRLPEFTRWDGGLFYTQGRMNASLYVENLFDRRYEATSIDANNIFPGAPVTVRAQLGWTF